MAAVMEARFDLDCQNPLLINVIAERVLQFVPVTELKPCRLVCQLWWKESLARFRRTHWLKVSRYNFYSGRVETARIRGDADLDGDQMRKCLHIHDYISFLDDPLDPYKLRTHPFFKLKLYKSRLAFQSEKNAQLREFLTKGGSSIKFLELEQCTILTATNFCKILFRFAKKLEYLSLSGNVYKKEKCPRKNQLKNLTLETLVERESDVQSHLKYLKLGKVMFDTEPGDSLPLTWTELFAHFPNIQNLEFVTLEEETNKPDIHHILDSIHALRTQCGILQQIRGLDILNLTDECNETFDSCLRKRLRAMSLPLTFFAYDLGYEYTSKVDCERHLENAASTLETLVVYKGPYSAPFGSFPYGNSFPSLTKLTLIGPIVSDLRFLEQMPNLKIVRLFHEIIDEPDETAILRPKVMKQLNTFIKDDDDLNVNGEIRVVSVTVVGNTDFSQMSHLSFPNIEEFLVGEESCTAEHVEQLARLMPNVKRLRIGLDNGGFQAVCKYWKVMEVLNVNPAHVNEEGITGLVPGKETRLPNITDLKYLKKFGLSDGATKTGFSDVTDFSWENGLLHLNHLERVVVRCSLVNMSMENFKKFKSMFPPYPYAVIYHDVLLDDSDGDEESDLDSDAQVLEV